MKEFRYRKQASDVNQKAKVELVQKIMKRKPAHDNHDLGVVDKVDTLYTEHTPRQRLKSWISCNVQMQQHPLSSMEVSKSLFFKMFLCGGLNFNNTGRNIYINITIHNKCHEKMARIIKEVGRGTEFLLHIWL